MAAACRRWPKGYSAPMVLPPLEATALAALALKDKADPGLVADPAQRC